MITPVNELLGWREMAARLVAVLAGGIDPELCLGILNRLAGQAGDSGYPGFLKLLVIISESHHEEAKKMLSEALALSLQRMELPSGQLSAWGGSYVWGDESTIVAGYLGAVPRRSYGPIEYLTVWYCQKTSRPYLQEATYRYALENLIMLLNYDETAKRLYPAKINAELTTGSEGAYTRQTRTRLGRLVTAWQQNLSPKAIVAAALE